MRSTAPLPNRVTAFGTLISHPARGTFTGNRGGRFHDPGSRALPGRPWANRRWLCCSLTYPGRNRHPVWGPGYTHLFFLDEVTALAAGHRPCAECRRRDAVAFRRAAEVASGQPIASLPALDDRLHTERLDGRAKRRFVADAYDLPDGTCVAVGDLAFARRDGRRWAWSPDGYTEAGPWRALGSIEVLTPPTTIGALRAGYRPAWHPSAL